MSTRAHCIAQVPQAARDANETFSKRDSGHPHIEGQSAAATSQPALDPVSPSQPSGALIQPKQKASNWSHS